MQVPLCLCFCLERPITGQDVQAPGKTGYAEMLQPSSVPVDLQKFAQGALHNLDKGATLQPSSPCDAIPVSEVETARPSGNSTVTITMTGVDD